MSTNTEFLAGVTADDLAPIVQAMSRCGCDSCLAHLADCEAYAHEQIAAIGREDERREQIRRSGFRLVAGGMGA